ncbi:HigA family addiction module antitoxin [Corynebacterium sp. NPDC060344]|uniref:HigA family addiction module antitoxin n=1 Tax=Corynebacterium sp. NPDC060344 TaxID=3347101 RepID=UPI003661B170
MMHSTNAPTPGTVLRARFLAPLGLDAAQLAAATGLSAAIIEGILAGTVHVDDEIAACLGDFLGTDARFWLELQRHAGHGLLTA